MKFRMHKKSHSELKLIKTYFICIEHVYIMLSEVTSPTDNSTTYECHPPIILEIPNIYISRI